MSRGNSHLNFQQGIEKNTMHNAWRNYFKCKINTSYLLLTLFLAFLSMYLFKNFLIWNESRTGGWMIDDVLMYSLPSANNSTLIFSLTYICIIVGILYSLQYPQYFTRLLCSIVIIAFIRMITISLIPLIPPIGLIPLEDGFLADTFYAGRVLTRDLFFSGHTSNIILVGLLVENKWLKRIIFIIGFGVAILLIIQRVHYTIDVVAAPFFSYLTYRLAVKIDSYNSSRIISKHSEYHV